MKTRMVIGLVMTLVLGALMAAPVSAEPGKSNGKCALVTRGNPTDRENVCYPAVQELVGLPEVNAVEKNKWRCVYKNNGRPSKLFCRIKGADIDEEMVDPPDKPWGNVVRLRGQKALNAKICPEPLETDPPVGDLFRARFKLNAKGNGLLKCVYEPPTD